MTRSARPSVRARLAAAVSAVVLLLLTAVAFPATVQAADSHALITGSGSSWSANAVNQWIADVQSNGLKVVFTANGSASGRKDFSLSTTDFAVSDIGYLGKDPVTQETDSAGNRAYAYLPIVAGGTAFPYHVERAGQLVRNLRLSGLTLAKIFTNQITNWSDPAITADNNGQSLPSIPIIPVVHSEGSGSSAQFTTFLAKQYPSLWTPFNGGHDTLNEYYPRQGQAIAQNGSDGVMNYIASSAANGAIGFDEYSYALAKSYPVAKVENTAGFFTLPTQYNVAVALTQAQINTDKTSPNYLLQDLSNVYTYNDPRTYPLSSYSYMIIPTGASDSTMTTAKRQTLADYLYYSICPGQKEMGPIGYSPLPINLVSAGFDQIGQLKTADPNVDITNRAVTTCDNPTFVAGQPTRNYLAEIAPQPPACDKSGAGPCSTGGDTGTGPTPTASASAGAGSSGGSKGTTHGSSGSSGSSGSRGSPGSHGSSGPNGPSGSSGSSGSSAPSGPLTGGSVDPVTGVTSPGGSVDPVTGVTTPTGDGSTASGGGPLAPAITTTNLSASQHSSFGSILGPLAAIELAAIILVPPFAVQWLRRRKRGDA